MFKGKYGEGHNKNVICWAFYYVNDWKDFERENLQIMTCIFRYNNLVNALNSTTKKI